jgi:hypothetical protein
LCPTHSSTFVATQCGWGKPGKTFYGSTSSACACNPGQGFRRYQSAFADTRRRRRRRPTYKTAAFYYCHTDASFSDSRRRGILGISLRRRRNSRRRGKFTNVNTRRLEEEEGTFDELNEQAKASM